MLKKIKFKWEYLLIIFAIVFAFFFSLNTHVHGFITSDETVNYSFSLLYKNTGKLYYEEPLNDLADNIIRPRGVAPRNGKLVPTKFVGLPFYYGNIIKIFGERALPYLTPIFAAIGIFFIYLLGKELFGRKNGLISAFLALIFPPLLYWTGFSFMENVFASVFFILGLWAVFRGLRTKKLLYYMLAPIALGISWDVRLDVILFLLPLVLIILLNIKRINFKFLFVGLIIFILTVSPILYINKQIYGKSIATGQTFSSPSSTNVNNDDNSKNKQYIPALLPMTRLRTMIKHPNILSTNFRILIVSAPFFFFFLFGLLWFLKKRTINLRNSNYYCLFILLSISVFAFFYLFAGPLKHYGLDIHESYTRYFLPIYLSCIPLLVLFVQKLLELNKIATISFISLFIIFNISFISPLVIGNENTRKNLAQTSDFIIKNTEPNSVIFTKTLDKIIFPRRKVGTISFLHGSNKEEKLRNIINSLTKEDIPLYIYDYNLRYYKVDLELLNEKLQENGMFLQKIEDSLLFKITKT